MNSTAIKVKNKNKLIVKIWVLILIAMSTWIKIFSLEGAMNGFLVGVMGLTAGLLVIDYFSNNQLTKVDFLTWLLIFVLYLCANRHPERWRPSTFYYTCMFLITFLYFVRLLYQDKIDIRIYIKVLRFLIFAFTITIIIQEICVISGVEPINYTQSADSFLYETKMRANGLASEPSYVSYEIMILMASYILMQQEIDGAKYNFLKKVKSDKIIWLCYFWSMISTGSTTGVVLVGVTLIPLITKKNILFVVIFVIIALLFIMGYQENSLERAIDFIPALFSMDLDRIIAADDSAAWRVAPLIIIFRFYNFLSLDGIFGYGIDFSKDLCAQWLNVTDEYVPTGGFLSMIMDYGFFPFAVLISIMIKCSYTKNNIIYAIAFTIAIITSPLNSQLFWLTLMFMATNKYFLRKSTL